MEAGLEHLSWAGGTLRYVDMLLVVIQPTAKTLLTAGRTFKLAMELGIPQVAFIANRASGAQVAELERFAAERGAEVLVVIPDDIAVREADMQARCLLDVAPESPSVAAIARLADSLEVRFISTPA